MRNQKTPALVNLAVYTTITVFLWIFFDIYRTLKKPPILDIDTKTLEPINPNLNKELLNEIDSRIFYTGQVETDNQIDDNATESGLIE